ITLFIRQPPHVFGSGYVQTVGDEITAALYNLRKQARTQALNAPGTWQSVRLVDPSHNNVDYGTFKTMYTKGSKWKVINDKNTGPKSPCPSPSRQLTAVAAAPRAEKSCDDLGAVMADGFTDDTGAVDGVAFDLIVRPFQWKGVSSSLRHFVRDAL